jgi:hypothetical protein
MTNFVHQITVIKIAFVRLWFTDIHISMRFSKPVLLYSRGPEMKWGKCTKSKVFTVTNYDAVLLRRFDTQ